jgi:hypothetical protein
MTLLVLTLLPAQAFYNPTTGRWLSRDPIGERGGVNLTAFVKNNPATQYDFLGHETKAYEFNTADGNASVRVTATSEGAAICRGGVLLFKVHFYANQPDEGHNWIALSGGSFQFDGQSVPTDNFSGTPAMQWDNLFTVRLPNCPAGKQEGATVFAASMSGHPNLLSVKFKWSFSCTCICTVRDPLKVLYDFNASPPLFGGSFR